MSARRSKFRRKKKTRNPQRWQRLHLEALEPRRLLDASAPTLDALSDLSIDEDAPTQTLDLTGIGDGDDNSQALRVTASSRTHNIFPVAINFAIGNDSNGVAVGDFNSDGHQDLATANSWDDTLSILLGAGDGSFHAATHFVVSEGPYGVAVGDFDDDGNQDLATANQDSDDVSILLGNGDGTFGAPETFTVDSGPEDVSVGDFNGDGDQDLVTVNSWDDTISILLGDGNGSFETATHFAVDDTPFGVAVGDFNGDGNHDLVTAYYYGDNVNILFGNGDGTFGASETLVVDMGPEDVSVGDFNGDGHQDLVTANSWEDTMSILLGDGSGSFEAATHFAIGDTPFAVAVGDFDDNGNQDLVITNYHDDTVNILLGDREGIISNPTVTYTSAETTGSLAFTPVADRYGTTTITVTVEDGGLDNDLDTPGDNTTFSRTFNVTINPVNDVPVITILGQSPLVLEGVRGSAYNDPGYTAWDVENGNLSDQVEVSGAPADLGTTGEWQLGFNVVDMEGLAAVEQTRTVRIVDTLPPVTSLYLDEELIQQSDNSQLGIGGVPNTDPSQAEPTDSTSVGAAVKLATPIDRETDLLQPDGSPVNSRQIWVETWPAAAEMPPELPTASSWDKLEDPVATTTTILLVDLDGNGQEMVVEEVDFNQRSTYLFEYDAQDSSGNYAEQLAFALILNDRTPPVIQLGGEPVQIVEHGSAWTWGAATATDNIDGVLDDQLRYHIENITAATLVGTDLTYAEAASLLTTALVADYQVQISVTDNAGFYGQNAADNMAIAYQAISVRNTFNDDPTLDPLSDLAIDEDAPTQTIDLMGIEDGDDHSQALRVTATSSNPGLVPNPAVTYTSNEATGSLAFAPASDQYGTTTITVTVEDGGLDNDLATADDNATFSRTFDVTVHPVNDLPSDITLTPDSVAENLPASTLVGHLSAFDVDDSDHGLNYLWIDAHQAGSTSEIDDLLIRDLETDEVFYSNDFDSGSLDGLHMWFAADRGEPWQHDSENTRIEIGKLHLETTGFGQNGAGGYNSSAGLSVAKRLPENFEATFTLERLQWAGESRIVFFKNVPVASESWDAWDVTADTNFEEHGAWDLRITDPPNNRERVSVNAVGNETQIRFVKNNRQLQYFINGTLIEEVNNLNVRGMESDGSQITYELADGEGDNDNSRFEIIGDQLRLQEPLNHEVQSTHSIRVSATDQDGGTSFQVLQVTVTDATEPPTLDPLSDLTIDEDAPTQTVDLTGIDDGDNISQALQVTATSSNPGLITDPAVTYTSGDSAASLTFTPTADQYGTTTITVTVEDGGLDNDLETPGDNATFSRTFDVTVNPVNDDPTVADVVATTNEDTPLSISLPFQDIDGDPLSIQIVSADLQEDVQVEIDEDNLILHYDPTASAAMQDLDKADSLQEQIVLSVSDGQGGEATATVTIDVAGVTDWQNPHNPLDINGDGTISTIDIVLLINLLNLKGSHPLAGIDEVPPPWVDTNGDGSVSAIDVIRVINWINLYGIAEGEQTILPSSSLTQQRVAHSAGNVQAIVMPRRTLETGPAQHRAQHQAVWQETGSQKPVWQEQVWQETVSQVTVWQEQSPAQHAQPPLATEASERPRSRAPWAELVDALLFCEAAESDDDWEDLLTPLRKPR